MRPMIVMFDVKLALFLALYDSHSNFRMLKLQPAGSKIGGRYLHGNKDF